MAYDRVVEFRLYVAGDFPNSRRAINNLHAFCEEHLPGSHSIEVIDVFDVPERALADHIMLTPQLVVVSDRRTKYIVGDLSDTSAIHDATIDVKGI